MLHRFRRQHEQLRQVIARVLRPTVSTIITSTTAVSPDVQPSVESLVVDVTDHNSIDVRYAFYTSSLNYF